MNLQRLSLSAMLAAGSFLIAQSEAKKPIHIQIYSGGGLAGATRQFQLINESGTLTFKYQPKGKTRAKQHTINISPIEAEALFERLGIILSSIEANQINQRPCSDGNTYLFSLRIGAYERSWGFYNRPDLYSVSPELSKLVDELSGRAPRIFQIFTTMPPEE